jgi:hypothetical protein
MTSTWEGGDNDDGEDYNPDYDLERSLGPEDEDVLNESMAIPIMTHYV